MRHTLVDTKGFPFFVLVTVKCLRLELENDAGACWICRLFGTLIPLLDAPIQLDESVAFFVCVSKFCFDFQKISGSINCCVLFFVRNLKKILF